LREFTDEPKFPLPNVELRVKLPDVEEENHPGRADEP
jgi:hypothetical protein